MANMFAEKLELCVSEKMEQGIDKVNAKEMGEVVDMIKDSYEIEKLKAEKRYYDSVVTAMHERKEEDEYYDEMGYPVRRDSRGRYSSGGMRGGRMGYDDYYAYRPAEMTRDIYGYNGGGSGGSGGGSRGGRSGGSRGGSGSSRYGYSHDEYMEKRKEYPMTDEDSAKQRKQLLNDYMDDLYDMAKEMVADMSPDEKQMWKSKLTQIVNL